MTFGQCSQEVMTQFSGRTVKERENAGQGRRKKKITKINTIGKKKERGENKSGLGVSEVKAEEKQIPKYTQAEQGPYSFFLNPIYNMSV